MGVTASWRMDQRYLIRESAYDKYWFTKSSEASSDGRRKNFGVPEEDTRLRLLGGFKIPLMFFFAWNSEYICGEKSD